MNESVAVAVPRKGRPLEAILDRLASATDAEALADEVSSTLRYEKAITKGEIEPERNVYERLTAYSDPDAPDGPEYTLYRDDRPGFPRRIVFDSARVDVGGLQLRLIGREEPFRALRTHEFALGFDSADLVLEEAVTLHERGIDSIAEVNERIDPRDTDVRVVTGLGDTVYHTLLAAPDAVPAGESLDRSFVADYEGELCISPRYERLVAAVLGTEAIEDVEFVFANGGQEEERAIADAGVGVYLTVTGSTARDHGLLLGEQLFPSETVLLRNVAERTPAVDRVERLFSGLDLETELRV
ncbi:hypothetical protein AArcSl_1186 [Halalkaliarchaeum desulfuricum]|uniref:ATP phosphoribosyltransferase n=1 Tax=Halalkaliarchaeum desulfuricum TaxID=2055893 RepID=A0A343TI97_9EURY|nr:hypothetical protein [Halalkaliarchaeum desulfuricum]AUX08819.1 hypothetical protein AArcSl_1186 [Halalkaliarchaeum desulfuricum]